MHRFVKRGRVRDSHTVIYQIIISDYKRYLAFLKFRVYDYILDYESHIFLVNVQLYLLTQIPSLNRT